MDRAHPQRPLYYNGPARIRYPVQCVLTVLYTVFFGCSALILSFFDRRGRWVHGCARAWGGAILATCRARIEVEGDERLDPNQTYILMANHHSLFDIPVLLVALPFPFRMVAKASLFRIPFMGWYMSRAGYIPVERDEPRQAHRSLEEAGRRVASGLSVALFPEGTRSPEGTPGRFKPGGFHLARAAAVPVVPVGIVNSGRLLPRSSWHADPGIIQVRFGAPLDPAAFPEPRALQRAVRDSVMELIDRPRESS